MSAKHRKPDDLTRFVTRDELRKLLNLYHALHHTPWYVKLWAKMKRRFRATR